LLKASKPVKIGEARTKEVGTGQVSMRGLIGDRFLKMFFGGLSHRRKENPACKAGNALENEAKKPTEAGCTSKEDTPEKEASQEIEKQVK
jgi:hypothetical protein